MAKKLNWLDLIKDIESIHPNITVLRDQKYINIKTEIKYICKEHGEQTSRPDDLKSGHGCPECGGSKKLNWSDLIKDIELIHPNITIPIDQKYIHIHTKIRYICKHHGEKSARPSDLKQGHGCKDCLIESKWLDVIKDIELIHPNITVPRDQKYTNSKTKIKYNCKYHGEKSARPNDLKQGHGCKDCLIESKWLDVIKDIELIHPNITVPRDQKYINTKTEIKYICKEHGEQSARPDNLKRGFGCPECGLKRGNQQRLKKSREFYTKLVGVSFDDHQSIIRKYCRIGKSLKLEHDIHSQYDVNQISVYVEGASFFIFKNKYKIGHLNKEIAKSLINYFSGDYEIGVYITEVTGGGRKKFGVNIRVVVERILIKYTGDGRKILVK